MTNKTKKQMNKAQMKKTKGGLIAFPIITAVDTVDKLFDEDRTQNSLKQSTKSVPLDPRR